SVFSAFGAAGADVRRDGARTVLVSLPVDAALLEQTFAELEAEVIGQLRARTDARVPIEVSREADVRFTRQNWEVTVALPAGRIDEHAVRQLEQAFLDKYERLYGKGLALRESGIELVTCRAVGRGRVPKPEIPRRAGACQDALDAARAAKPARPVWIPLATDGTLERMDVAVFDGSRLLPGMRLTGPAVIEHADTTIFVPPNMRAVIDELESCVIAEAA